MARVKPYTKQGDHPRMRGEHVGSAQSRATLAGSSPHARGALVPRQRGARLGGIIPACAGSTGQLSGETVPLRDHPRMRGEHEKHRVTMRSPAGSSPHARGAPRTPCWSTSQGRIIPACAGSTHGGAARAAPAGDHPRMRGEHTGAFRKVPRTLGSSPHARGAPALVDLAAALYGIIPACAGSTCRSCG